MFYDIELQTAMAAVYKIPGTCSCFTGLKFDHFISIL